MEKLSIFDIAGPVMVGPSSSHTAGACKIGQFARALFHRTPKEVTFYLHGSFAEVYAGHATDLALLAGVMKFRTSDPRMKDAFKIAEKKGIKYKFKKTDLGEKFHPNSVRIILERGKYRMSVTGSSIGGGMIDIVKIDNFEVHIPGRAGKYLSLVICHRRVPGVIPRLIKNIEKLGINIVNVVKKDFKGKRLSVLSVEGKRMTLPQVMELEKNAKNVEFIRSLSKLQSE
jgi:L-serine dehydratase